MTKRYLIMSIMCLVFFVSSTKAYTYVDEWTYIEKGSRLEEEKRFVEAIFEYNNALKYKPTKIDLYIKIGNLYERKLGDLVNAIKIYEEGLKIEPNNYLLNYNLMYAVFKAKGVSEGIKQYELLSTMRSDTEVFVFPKKDLESLKANMTQEELKEFCKKYLLINPSDTVLREKLLKIYKKNNDYINARHELKELIKWGKSSSFFLFDLGVCSYHVGDYKEALNYLTKAKDQGESVPELYFDLINKKLQETNRRRP